MVMYKCKMCGGDIFTEDSATFGTCESCQTTSTLPKASDEKLLNLFNRANYFRRQNEFDKAMGAYEAILNEDNTNAEAHWCTVLCRYGIEYVEDPATRERICNLTNAKFTLNCIADSTVPVFLLLGNDPVFPWTTELRTADSYPFRVAIFDIFPVSVSAHHNVSVARQILNLLDKQRIYRQPTGFASSSQYMRQYFSSSESQSYAPFFPVIVRTFGFLRMA